MINHSQTSYPKAALENIKKPKLFSMNVDIFLKFTNQIDSYTCIFEKDAQLVHNTINQSA